MQIFLHRVRADIETSVVNSIHVLSARTFGASTKSNLFIKGSTWINIHAEADCFIIPAVNKKKQQIQFMYSKEWLFVLAQCYEFMRDAGPLLMRLFALMLCENKYTFCFIYLRTDSIKSRKRDKNISDTKREMDEIFKLSLDAYKQSHTILGPYLRTSAQLTAHNRSREL